MIIQSIPSLVSLLLGLEGVLPSVVDLFVKMHQPHQITRWHLTRWNDERNKEIE